MKILIVRKDFIYKKIIDTAISLIFYREHPKALIKSQLYLYIKMYLLDLFSVTKKM